MEGEDGGELCDTLDKLVTVTYDMEWAGTKNAKNALSNARDVAAIHGGAKHPKTVTSKALFTLVAALQKRGLEGATINRKLSALHVMLKQAKRAEVISELPDFEPFWRPDGRKRDRYYSEEEERSILDYFEKHEDRDMRDVCIALVDTGCRLSEALSWSWRDIPKIGDGEPLG